jgi:hypothetical protein
MAIPQSHSQLDHGLHHDALGMAAQGFQANADSDPVEAYFECITTCSLDDGECITVCTNMLRDQV